MTSNNESVSGKQFLGALIGIGIMLGFLVACGFGGYFYGVTVGRAEVLDEAKPKAVEKPVAPEKSVTAEKPVPTAESATGQNSTSKTPVIAEASAPAAKSASAAEHSTRVFSASENERTRPALRTGTKYSAGSITGVPSWSELNQKFVTNRSEAVSDSMAMIGNQYFSDGDFANAEACYLRSIAVDEAEARYIYGEQKEATVIPAETTDDVLKDFKSIMSLTEDTHPHSFYTIVIGVTNTMHRLAIIEDLRGNYADGDRLFKTVFMRHLFNSCESTPPFPTSFGSEEGLQNVENGYKSLVTTVEKKYGADSAFAATRLEQLAMCYDSMPQWVYSASVKGKQMTQKQIRDVIAQNNYSPERAQLVKDTFARAINIRQTVKDAADPDIVAYDQRRSKPSTYHNVH